MWDSGDEDSGSIPGDSEKFFIFLKPFLLWDQDSDEEVLGSIPGEGILFYIFQLDLSEKVKQNADAKIIKNNFVKKIFE